MPDGVRIGVPLAGQRLFFGDKISAAAYDAALARFAEQGATIVEVDIEPFYAAARLLYEGPWVAERYLTVKDMIASSPELILPVTRQIILAGAHGTAADAFAAFYQLEALRRVRDHVFRSIDALVVPTAPTIYSVEQVLADPIHLNSRLGTYTNFVNLLDLARARGAGIDAAGRHAVRRDAARARRRGCQARRYRAAIPSRYRPAARRAQTAAAAAREAVQ